MPEGRRPRGVTPRPRSGAAAESARLQQRRNGREELPKSEVRGGGREDPMPEGRQPREVTPCPRSGAAAQTARLQRHRNGREELPKSEARGGGQEDQPHVQGAVAVRAQEGLEELSHAEGQEGRR